MIVYQLVYDSGEYDGNGDSITSLIGVYITEELAEQYMMEDIRDRFGDDGINLLIAIPHYSIVPLPVTEF